MNNERKTAYGLICKVCGQDKEPYQFFQYSGKYDRSFFVTGYQPGVCWDCAAPYCCVVCHQEKPATDYRVGGRICTACKQARLDFVAPQNNALDTEYIEVDENAQTEAGNGGSE